MHCNSVYDRRLLYSFHHASAVPKHLHSGLSLFLYGESYDPGRIGTDLTDLCLTDSDSIGKYGVSTDLTRIGTLMAIYQCNHNYPLKVELDHCDTGSAGLFVFIFDTRNQLNRSQIFANLLFEGSGTFAV